MDGSYQVALLRQRRFAPTHRNRNEAVAAPQGPGRHLWLLWPFEEPQAAQGTYGAPYPQPTLVRGDDMFSSRTQKDILVGEGGLYLIPSACLEHLKRVLG